MVSIECVSGVLFENQMRAVWSKRAQINTFTWLAQPLLHDLCVAFDVRYATMA